MVVEPPRQRAPEPAMATTFETEPEEEVIEDNLLAAAMRREEHGAEVEEEEGDSPFDSIAQMMMEQPPAPIPDMFATQGGEQRPRRRGTLVLTGVAAILVLAVAGGAAYFLQDQLINKYPAAAQIFDKAHLRNEVVGAGLEFRGVGAERSQQDGHEVLVVRGVIANTTDNSRSIPPVRLALYDGQTLVQEKTIDAPQPKIDGKGTASFRVALDLPDPHASRFEVTFAAAEKSAAKNGGGKDSGMKDSGAGDAAKPAETPAK
ncbi:MAG: DUF3426 domain-containing protein [Terriglobales bacterium]